MSYYTYMDPEIINKEKIDYCICYAYAQKFRIRLWYGDTETGACWNEENDILGYVSKSTGIKPCYILLHNKNSIGGGEIMIKNIVRIDRTDKRQSIYIHPEFRTQNIYGARLITCSDPAYSEGYRFEVYRRDLQRKRLEIIARFGKGNAASRFADFMNGERYSK